MKKRLKGKTCVYCVTRPAVTEDHVLSRKTFHTKGQPKMPVAPSCAQCNRLKSDLEHYAGSVLLFASKHPEAVKNLSTIGERRLAKNPKLKAQLYKGIGREWRHGANGLISPAMTMPVDSKRLEQLAAMIGRGLLWHFWQVTLAPTSTAIAIWLSQSGESLISRMLQLKSKDRLSYALDSGMFSCEATLSDSNPQISVWKMSFFGGIELTGDTASPDADTSQLAVMTGPSSILRPGRFEVAFAGERQTGE